jgi:Uma2 family endonuclease
MVQALNKSLTLDEFLKLPETKPASEFIEGHLIQKPMPQGKHSTLQLDLGAGVNLALKPQRIARAYTELRCTQCRSPCTICQLSKTTGNKPTATIAKAGAAASAKRSSEARL